MIQRTQSTRTTIGLLAFSAAAAVASAADDAGLRVPVRGPIRLYTGEPEPLAWWADPLLWWCMLAALVAVFVAASLVYVWRRTMLQHPGQAALARLARLSGLSRAQREAVRIASERVGIPPIAVLLSRSAARRVPGVEAVLSKR